MCLVAVILPDLGTGPDTPIIVSYWFAARGETVWEGDRLVEVLAGAATFDVSAPATGRLVEIRAREDDLVHPGDLLGRVAVDDEEEADGGSVGRPDSEGGEPNRDPPSQPRPPGHRPT